MILVLVCPRVGSGGLSWLAGVTRFVGPLLESLSVPVCCGGRGCLGGRLLATGSSACGPMERLPISGGSSRISGGGLDGGG